MTQVIGGTVTNRLIHPGRHYHAVFLDGVFAAGDDGALRFHPLPSLSNGEVADLMQASLLNPMGPRATVRNTSAIPPLASAAMIRYLPKVAAICCGGSSGLEFG